MVGLLRPAWLVSVAALPFACSVYGPDLLGPAGGQAGTGEGLAGEINATAGDAPDGESGNGGRAGHAAGATGGGRPTEGGASGMGAANSTGGAPAADTAGEGGAGLEPSSAGSGAGTGGARTGGAGNGGAGKGGAGKGGASAGGAGAGGAGAGGASAGGAGAGGASTGGAGGAGGAAVIPGIVAAYPCESANGAVLADASGQGKNASLANGAGGSPVGFSFSSGVVGNALTLNATDLAYVSLPKGIVAQLTELTIATWVKLKSGTAFQRIFDLGVDTGTFMYLVNSGNNGLMRFRIASAPLNKNQIVEGAEALPVAKWVHVAVTVGDNGVSIYLDGAQIAQQAPAVLRPSDLGQTVNNFIGRSPFASDPYLDGQIDEFRIYNRVLSSVEIGVLASGH